jgi:hypothetical protein
MEMSPSQVSNFDIAALCDRTTIFAREVYKSASSFNGGVYLEADLIRANTYLDALEQTLVQAETNPLDLPKVHGEGFSIMKEFPTDEEIVAIENQNVKDLMRRLQALWKEMSNSQSADLMSGVNQFDAARIRAVLVSSRAVLANAAEQLDLPENYGNVPIPSEGGRTTSLRRTVRTLR